MYSYVVDMLEDLFEDVHDVATPLVPVESIVEVADHVSLHLLALDPVQQVYLKRGLGQMWCHSLPLGRRYQEWSRP